MPELKHSFTGGKMNKDLDERLIPNGEYRHAMNVQVSNSEGSDVGVIENLHGNSLLPQNAIRVPKNSVCLGTISDEKDNSLYWFVNSATDYVPDYIMQNVDLGGEAERQAQTGQMPVDNPLFQDYFNLETSGGAIMKYSDANGIEAVVWEAKEVFCSVNAFTYVGDVYTNTTPPVLIPGYNNITVSPNTWNTLLVGMELVSLDIIDPNYTAGSPGVVLQSVSYAANPPIITYRDQLTSTIQLSYLPVEIQSLPPTGGSVIAMRFVNNIASPLNFNSNSIITGINIIDDMLFWTDNYNEPKKINIPRSIEGTPEFQTLQYPMYSHTRLICQDRGITWDSGVMLAEKHVTMIKQAPTTAPAIELITDRDYSLVGPEANPAGLALREKSYTGVLRITDGTGTDDLIRGEGDSVYYPYDFSAVSLGDRLRVQIAENIYGNDDFELLWPMELGTVLVLKEFNNDGTPPPTPISNYRIKVKIVAINSGNYIAEPLDPIILTLEVITIAGFAPVATNETNGELKYAIDLFEEQEKIFEFKFPRFATRYKYEDSEYSAFSPFTDVAFVPGTFDYHPKKGYNLGMTNRLREVLIKNFRLNDTPLDVVAIDILFKEDQSPNVYVIDTIRPNEETINYWDDDVYRVTNETIKSIVPSNQLLRPYDNVPRKALAQEVIGNRIVYGNYLQGFNLITENDKPYRPDFTYDILENDSHKLAWNSTINSVQKSIKSLREYQLGVVFVDEYGRETPVLSNKSGTFKLDKKQSSKANRLRVGFNLSSVPPKDMKYYKFYIKQTSGEYYNLAMGRWYDAEDGNIWVGFPSTDRNKVDDETYLILKKAAGSNTAVEQDAKFKVLAIENQAPDFIKQNRKLIVKKKHVETSSGTSSTDIFDLDIPRPNRDEFSIRYNAFFASSGNKLHEIEDDLYVSFTQGTNVSSDRYRIVSLTLDEDSAPSQPRYHFKLEKEMGSDVNFITDDPLNGTNVTQIEDGTEINIFRYRVENSPEFDGKFFVKLFKNEVAREHLQGNADLNKEFRPVSSKDIYLMRGWEWHSQTHGPTATGHGLDVTNNNTSSAYTAAFGEYACYFRLYNFGNSDPQDGTNPVGSAYDEATSKYRFVSPSSITYDSTGAVNQSDYDSWLDEWNNYTGIGVSMNSSNEYLNPNGKVTGSVESNDARADSPLQRPNEVWFIDMGQYRHSHPSYPGIWWANVPWGNINNDNPAEDYGLAGGSMQYPSSRYFRMNLTFGPVLTQNSMGRLDKEAPRKSHTRIPDVFNVGAGNPMYEDDAGFIQWIDQISPGSSWRWADDPNQIVYNIRSEGVNYTRKFRYYGGYETNEQGTGHKEFYDDNVNSQRTHGAQLSPNFNTAYSFNVGHSEQVNWIPVSGGGADRQPVIGPIEGGLTTTLTTENPSIDNFGATDFIEDFHIIVTKASFENSIASTYPDFPAANIDDVEEGERRIAVKPGMILVAHGDDTAGNNGNVLQDESACTGGSTAFTHPYLAVRKIEPVINNSTQATEKYKIYLTGYYEALDFNHVPGGETGQQAAIGTTKNVYFAQATMNGYSPNSVQRISLQKSTTGAGAFTNSGTMAYGGPSTTLLHAVGYTMEFVEEFTDDQGLPENPAIWETEPKETPDLDIYYEASGLIPFEINSDTMSTMIPLKNESVYPLTPGSTSINLGSYEDCTIESSQYTLGFTIPERTKIISIEGNILTIDKDLRYDPPVYDAVTGNFISGDTNDYDALYNLTTTGYPGWGPAFNAAGAGSVFLQDINQFADDQGVSSSSTVYVTRPDGTSFTIDVIDIKQAKPPGDEYNRIVINKNTYQSWHTLNWHNCYSFLNGVESNRIRDSFNLPFVSNGVKASTTLDTDKYVEEHRKNGLIFSGLYNENVSLNNLNQFIQAEKITKDVNPEYGSIQKLHTRDSDLITLCEDKVLKILANKDAVFNADGNAQLTANQNVLGQTIPFVGDYGISKNPESFASEAYRIYFADKTRGSVMRLSRDGLTPISDHGMKDWFRDNLRLSNQIIGSYDDRQGEYNISIKDTGYLVSFDEAVRGWVSFKSFAEMEQGVSMSNDYYTFKDGYIYRHHSDDAFSNQYNEFYGFTTASTVTTIINEDPGTVKNFQTLSYEGSKGRITPTVDDSGNPIDDGQYYNLQTDQGWYLSTILTDLESGSLVEFIKKENKWFNYIKGICGGEIDDTKFSYQGLGVFVTSQITNLGTGNFKQQATSEAERIADTTPNNILTYINGEPLFRTLQLALEYGALVGLTGYHTHTFQDEVGYMAGDTHDQAVNNTGAPIIIQPNIERNIEQQETREQTRQTRRPQQGGRTNEQTGGSNY